MFMKKNVDFIYVFDTNERVFSITNRHFDNSIKEKVTMEQVNVMVEELKDITGETFEVVNPDDGWFDGLTINFKTDDNYFISGSSGSDCGAQTTHDWDGVLERIYDFNGIYDTTIENYVVNAGGIIDWNGYDEQPNIQITGDGYSHVLKVMSLTEDYLELFKTQMDTFTHHWDPLNDTVYWSNYEETRKYSR